MRHPVHLPQLELTMESVAIVAWRVQVGDFVNEGQPLLEVESEKALSEVPAPVSGYVRKLCVQAGDSIGEKALLCVLTDAADEPMEDDAAPRQRPAASVTTPALPTGAAAAEEAETGIIKAVPAARKLAKDLGIDLAAVKGTGPGGRITVADVQAAAR